MRRDQTEIEEKLAIFQTRDTSSKTRGVHVLLTERKADISDE
nr:MAG TPA: hypothetical protein [Caudoviricetes sp.]